MRHSKRVVLAVIVGVHSARGIHWLIRVRHRDVVTRQASVGPFLISALVFRPYMWVHTEM